MMGTSAIKTANASASMGLEWSDLNVILAIGRSGSLSGAARELGHNHSTIFRKINAIEDKTKVRFFERLNQGYVLTEAGDIALRYAERIESEMHALSREVLGQDTRLQGIIRVTAPEGITMFIAPSLFAEFCRQHPAVSIEITGGSAALDLSRREADVAIRATPKPPDTSLGRKICDFRFAFYATPRYWKKHQALPLSEQDWVFISGTLDWLVPLIWKKSSHGARQAVFSSGNSLAVINACGEGMGVSLLPCYLGDRDKRLRRIGEPVQALTIELWVLTHPDLRHTARVKALIAFLNVELAKMADLFAGKLAQEPVLALKHTS